MELNHQKATETDHGASAEVSRGKMILKREGGIWGGKIYYTCKDFRHEGKSYSVYYVRNLNGDRPTLKVTRLDYWQPRTLADWVFVPVDVCGLHAVIRRYVPGVKILEINN